MRKIIALAIILLISFTIFSQQAAAQGAPRLVVRVNEDVYVPGDGLVVFGKGLPDDALSVKLSDPSGKAVKIANLPTDEEGSFSERILVWPQPSKSLVYGRYTLEVSSSRLPSDRETLSFSFAEERGRPGELSPPVHILSVKLDSPTGVSTDASFRIFVQVTFDGALIDTDKPEDLVLLLGSSHIHSGDSTINLSGTFSKLHEGLYYADVELKEEGTYIIHAIAFHRGLLSHDSRVITSGGSIVSIQESVDRLNKELGRASVTLNETKAAAADAIEAVDLLNQASGQINSLLLPLLALISIIIALQISLFARIRASYR